MSYVRTLLSEYQTCDWETVRRYLVEVPPSWRGVDPRFNKDLITLELWLSEGTRLHYENMPYMLAETVWLRQTRIECDLGECGIAAPALRKASESRATPVRTRPVRLQPLLGGPALAGALHYCADALRRAAATHAL